MNTLDYFIYKFGFDPQDPSPIKLTGVGRDHLTDWIHDLDFKSGVEVGVAEGFYSEVICEANPQMTVYGIDPYQAYKNYSDYKTNEVLANLQQEAKFRLSKFANYIFIEEFSANALKKIDDESLDFVYIDANHDKPYITQDIEGWNRKVKPGGIVAGHDYGGKRGMKVAESVANYTTNNHIYPWFILTQDDPNSWMWIKT